MKTSLVVLALLGIVSIDKANSSVEASESGRYFPKHSWDKVDPDEFIKNLNKEVAAEKEVRVK